MKSGCLTSLSALALHSDVPGVRLRYEQGPPPRIQPLLTHPCSFVAELRFAAAMGAGSAGLRRRFGFGKGSSLLLVAMVR